MELDKRIIEGKKPLDCFDAENSELMKSFLNKEGYVSNNLENFCLLDGCFKKLLSNVFKELKSCFTDDEGRDWKYFLPIEWVKEPEKKYRPYSLNEFLNEHEVGDKITYRTCRFKDSKEQEFIRYKAMICGYQIMEGEANTPGKGFINLGGFWVSLQAMFDDYETPNSYLYPEVWQPFGVIEE